MRSWADKYIGVPHENTLSGNCYGFAVRVYREVFGRDLMGMLTVGKAVLRGKDLPFRKVETPKDGDLVLLGNRHVGLWCAASRTVVHSCDVRGEVVSIPMAVARFVYGEPAFYEVEA